MKFKVVVRMRAIHEDTWMVDAADEAAASALVDKYLIDDPGIPPETMVLLESETVDILSDEYTIATVTDVSKPWERTP